MSQKNRSHISKKPLMLTQSESFNRSPFNFALEMIFRAIPEKMPELWTIEEERFIWAIHGAKYEWIFSAEEMILISGLCAHICICIKQYFICSNFIIYLFCADDMILISGLCAHQSRSNCFVTLSQEAGLRTFAGPLHSRFHFSMFFHLVKCDKKDTLNSSHRQKLFHEFHKSVKHNKNIK